MLSWFHTGHHGGWKKHHICKQNMQPNTVRFTHSIAHLVVKVQPQPFTCSLIGMGREQRTWNSIMARDFFTWSAMYLGWVALLAPRATLEARRMATFLTTMVSKGWCFVGYRRGQQKISTPSDCKRRRNPPLPFFGKRIEDNNDKQKSFLVCMEQPVSFLRLTGNAGPCVPNFTRGLSHF